MFASFKPSGGMELPRFLEEAAQERLLLILNHVLTSEPVAQQRLQAHAGRRLRLSVQGWPALAQMLVPAPRPWCVAISPAGLLEGASDGTLEGTSEGKPEGHSEGHSEGISKEGEPDLDVVLDASNPLELMAQVAAGQTPTLRLAGDARLAADVNWLAENIRWDIAADLERVFGPMPAEQMRVWGVAVMQGLREAVARLGALAPRPPQS